MQRIRKEDGTAKIVIRIEKKCQVGEITDTLAKIQEELAEGSVDLIENIPRFDEVHIDKNGDMSTKRKREVAPPTKEEKEAKKK